MRVVGSVAIVARPFRWRERQRGACRGAVPPLRVPLRTSRRLSARPPVRHPRPPHCLRAKPSGSRLRRHARTVPTRERPEGRLKGGVQGVAESALATETPVPAPFGIRLSAGVSRTAQYHSRQRVRHLAAIDHRDPLTSTYCI